MSISRIEFGILSAARILERSVAEVTSDKLPSDTKVAHGTLYDPRFGAISDDDVCETCGFRANKCPGHWGHIVLNRHIFHPAPYFNKLTIEYLKCFCFSCSRLVLSRPQLKLMKILSLAKTRRHKAILNAVEKVEFCWNCREKVPKFFVQNPKVDPKIMMFYNHFSDKKKSRENCFEVDVAKAEEIFKKIVDDDIRLFGFDPERSHPKNLIISILPVMPTNARPPVMNGERCDDDITTLFRDIIKANTRYNQATNEDDRIRESKSIAFYYSTILVNKNGKSKQPNGRPRSTIDHRIKGKEGLVRNNLAAKRTEFGARTVICGDPSLYPDQIGIPLCIAKALTVPVMVQAYNIRMIQSIVDAGDAKSVVRVDEKGESRTIILRIACRSSNVRLCYGDRYFRKSTSNFSLNKLTSNDALASERLLEGEIEIDVQSLSDIKNGDRIIRMNGEHVIAEIGVRRKFTLQIGDKVHRYLRDGDWVIVNRQPSLHIGSMLAGRVRLNHPKIRAICIALSLTTPMNADFDGDEMNIHVPQTAQAIAEIMELFNISKNIISGQASRPIMGIVQDSLVGSYKMTSGWVSIEKNRFFDICTAANLDISRFDHISRVYSEIFPDIPLRSDGYHPYLFTGRGILSMCFPRDFIYTLHNKAHPEEPYLRIRCGTIFAGTLDKSAVGPKAGAVHHHLSSRDGIAFLGRFQHIVNNWFRDEGFSVGIRDCIPATYNKSTGMIQTVSDNIKRCFFRAQLAISTQKNKKLAEFKVMNALNAARDSGHKEASRIISPSNRFLALTNSGSKGSASNLAQIIALVGQQSVCGARIQNTCLEGNRSLPHYPITGVSLEEFDMTDSTPTIDEGFQMAGFVENSFFAGINPQEFISHLAGSREGGANNSNATGKVGYLQRRLSEYLGSINPYPDQSVRTAEGRIVQFLYGGDGISPRNQHRMDGGLCINISSAVEALNSKYEMECYDKGIDPNEDDGKENMFEKSAIESFRRARNLAISTAFEADTVATEEHSPLNSYGSDSEISTPTSVGSLEDY